MSGAYNSDQHANDDTDEEYGQSGESEDDARSGQLFVLSGIALFLDLKLLLSSCKRPIKASVQSPPEY